MNGLKCECGNMLHGANCIKYEVTKKTKGYCSSCTDAMFLHNLKVRDENVKKGVKVKGNFFVKRPMLKIKTVERR